MAEVMRVIAFPVGPQMRNAGAELFLPATPWQLLDVMDRIGLQEDETLHCEVVEVHDGDVFGEYLPNDPDLFQLNALAQQFSEMSDGEKNSLYGLVRTEGTKIIPLPQLIDMAYSAQDIPIREVFSSLDLTPKRPDYTVLLALDNGYTLKLPAPPPALLPAERFRCVDCAAPMLAQAITDSDDIRLINRMAGVLNGLNEKELPAYKALIEATHCSDLRDAVMLADGLDSYLFGPSFNSPEDVAIDELIMSMDESVSELLIPHLDLHGYGESLIESRGYSMTNYGLIERRDGGPMPDLSEQASTRGPELSM